ncbi:hypothetical protein VHEMI04825 [[Torrubiella] hemipterigena]|uniref:CENP-V/GFA domain-containing protein n=1 Tax=[Torrubiella] hemipterigena TaxID=1531966 RepID=A0A0A1SWB3_9HYPO|nr:hypothetical protein VHEMI04825 [[Torrubiella] hemipterigena]
MDTRCQCGAVAFKTPSPSPLALYICHCRGCKLQTGSAFGTSAIFPRFALPENENLSCYSRPTAKGPLLYCYFCRQCGTRLLHSTPAQDFVSVKGGCIQGLDWSQAIHICTNSAMVPIPEGAETASDASTPTEFVKLQNAIDQPPSPSADADTNA